MKEKERLIIESAIKLFAVKGFSSTSVQEIATDCGISKGAFYLYFKSKDKLLESILEFYFDQLKLQMLSTENSGLPSKEKFIVQLTSTLDMISNHKDFIIMQSREQMIPLNETIKNMLFIKQMELQTFYKNGLEAIYGSDSIPYLWDLSQLLEGMLQSYIRFIIFDKELLSTKDIAEYIMNRMDSIAEGMTKDKPLISDEKMNQFLKKFNFCYPMPNTQSLITNIRGKINDLHDKESLHVSLDLIETEIKREQPRTPVIQGMLSNFSPHPKLKEELSKALEPFT
ncbi:TetR/AcrR family transcriptional regulator [Cytobacillus purgationiresistens]|uniref:AcrR family transcriptional regulator n=1 Tax=Cytobacillus purgationiresistens TaxID=863449 RepID=A0ABU0AQZ7_9BACI|nr:TetR/AcrR family transcriptional regulator [Cytobacillus purgationiresistens]MDQ0273640.1 AcrR family transcriptional regulator [Cytobacillus purgationiresistens]